MAAPAKKAKKQKKTQTNEKLELTRFIYFCFCFSAFFAGAAILKIPPFSVWFGHFLNVWLRPVFLWNVENKRNTVGKNGKKRDRETQRGIERQMCIQATSNTIPTSNIQCWQRRCPTKIQSNAMQENSWTIQFNKNAMCWQRRCPTKYHRKQCNTSHERYNQISNNIHCLPTADPMAVRTTFAGLYRYPLTRGHSVFYCPPSGLWLPSGTQ